jgi:hypothetical protein
LPRRIGPLPREIAAASAFARAQGADPLEIANDFGLDLQNFRSVKLDLPHPPCKQVR